MNALTPSQRRLLREWWMVIIECVTRGAVAFTVLGLSVLVTRGGLTPLIVQAIGIGLSFSTIEAIMSFEDELTSRVVSKWMAASCTWQFWGQMSRLLVAHANHRPQHCSFGG